MTFTLDRNNVSIAWGLGNEHQVGTAQDPYWRTRRDREVLADWHIL